jgi:hypothetical protein
LADLLLAFPGDMRGSHHGYRFIAVREMMNGIGFVGY